MTNTLKSCTQAVVCYKYLASKVVKCNRTDIVPYHCNIFDMDIIENSKEYGIWTTDD